VLTGVVLIAGFMKEFSGTTMTRVHMRKYTDSEIEWYISTGESMGRAGAYAIQGQGAVLVDRIEGCYYNVVGLPVALTIELLKRAGYNYWGTDDVEDV